MREIGRVKFSKETYTDANMLLNYGIVDAVSLNKNLTYLWGKEDNRFPLLSLTEGQGLSIGKKPINAGDSQYKWRVAGRQRRTSQIVRLVSQVECPGLGYSEFEVEMRDNFFIYQWGAISPDGASLVRIQSEGKKTTQGTYIYVFQLQTGDANAYVNLDNFQPGLHWGEAIPTIPSSKSDGNRFRSQTWSEATNQFSWHRFSQQIAGNVANIVVDFEFNMDDGGTQKGWMPYEQKLFELAIRQMREEDLWYSEYNRDSNGVIHLKDPENGEPIPRGNGIFATLEAVNNIETFSKLTLERIDNTLTRIFDNRNDSSPVEIVLYAGKGFARLFNEAIEDATVNKGFFVALGENKIKDKGDYLSYGKYFRQYENPYGQTITVKVTDMFSKGTRGEQDRLNGRMYKGLPYADYTGVFLDHSMNDLGERNIQMVYEEGREYQVGVYKGMSPLPDVWGAANDIRIATRKDIATYEVICSQGINMLNPLTSFALKMEH